MEEMWLIAIRVLKGQKGHKSQKSQKSPKVIKVTKVTKVTKIHKSHRRRVVGWIEVIGFGVTLVNGLHFLF